MSGPRTRAMHGMDGVQGPFSMPADHLRKTQVTIYPSLTVR